MSRQYVDRILKARVYDVATQTPLHDAPNLCARLANRVLLKREDLQPVFSFKIRGAYNRLVSLTSEERGRGVIAASAGNHAQGVAYSGRHLGIATTIVMPKTTPPIKVDAVRRFGAEVILYGSSFDEARQHMETMVERTGCVYVPPFDDPMVIAGQGTVGMEILRQHTDALDAVFVPVGGGGLIAGVSAYIKSLWPQIRVIGVEPRDAPTLASALQAQAPVTLTQVGIFADGVAVARIGDAPFEIARQCVDEVILVSTDEICAAIKDIYEDTRSIAEPAGAVATAGLKRYVAENNRRGDTLVAIDSGANVNFDRLRHIAERAEIGEQREGLLAVTIPERKGSFRRFCHAIGHRQITEFNYRYADAQDAQVFVGLELRDGVGDKDALIASLREQGYRVLDMTDNELAKLHVRHMVGGHAAQVTDEKLYRFEFPERPGALLRFLTHVGARWNISLFHYRNHGAAYGRVLVGVQVPDTDGEAFAQFLANIGYRSERETDNAAYRLFLS
ncbi:MAG: threonine ammonia-lyase, biosynthetic [Gammaproteobacteria bacterium]|nr:threonine ammonia-lyase, biosynthetic [Gammaproteobacteria bacterium]